MRTGAVAVQSKILGVFLPGAARWFTTVLVICPPGVRMDTPEESSQETFMDRLSQIGPHKWKKGDPSALQVIGTGEFAIAYADLISAMPYDALPSFEAALQEALLVAYCCGMDEGARA